VIPRRPEDASMIKPYYSEPGIEIYHGDCRDILPHLPKVDLVLTDPPYGIGKVYGEYIDTDANLLHIIQSVMPMLFIVSKRIVITPGVNNVSIYPKPDWILAWVYGTTNTYGGWGFSSWQPILAYGKDPYLQNGMGARMDIIYDSKTPAKNEHPCPKPETFTRKLLLRASALSSDTILDPFMGSGTTLVAAKQLGRKAIGIEIEKKYCDIAIDRLRQEVLPLTQPEPKQEQEVLL